MLTVLHRGKKRGKGRAEGKKCAHEEYCRFERPKKKKKRWIGWKEKHKRKMQKKRRREKRMEMNTVG